MTTHQPPSEPGEIGASAAGSQRHTATDGQNCKDASHALRSGIALVSREANAGD